MARKLPAFGQELVAQIEEAWGRSLPDWARKRLLFVLLIDKHRHSVAQVMENLRSLSPDHLPLP